MTWIARLVILTAGLAFAAPIAALAAGGDGGGGGGGFGSGVGVPPVQPGAAGTKGNVPASTFGGSLFKPAPEQAPAAGRSGTAKQVPTCPTGFALQRGNCVRLKSEAIPDDDLYIQGRALALAGFYEEGLELLNAVSRADDTMVYTMRGYATRKLGRFDEGMALYEKALAIDPDNINTHEYKGEGFVSVGLMDRARDELAIVKRLCKEDDCEQYEDLAKAIETGQPE